MPIKTQKRGFQGNDNPLRHKDSKKINIKSTNTNKVKALEILKQMMRA